MRWFALVVLFFSCSKLSERQAKFPEKVKGMSLPVWERNGYLSDKYEKAIDYLKELGVNFVAIIPTLYQKTLTDSVIFEDSRKTPSFESVEYAIRKAKEKGFYVMLKPHIDLEGPIYRGLIDPHDIDKWTENYLYFMRRYAKLAQKYGVELFCIGTELETISTKYPQVFSKIIDEVRRDFSQKLIYAANWTEYTKITFWDKLDFIGIDAYFHVAEDNNPQRTQLVQEWEKILEDIKSFAGNKEVIFTEIGYMSVDGSCSMSWNYLIEAQEDQEEQALCYDVVLSYVFPKIKGLFFWEWEFYSDELGRGYTPRGKKAEKVIEKYWKSE